MVADKEAVLEHLDAILISSDFANSPKLSAFLRYVVTETLEGREKGLKAYSIGVDVLDRPDDFDSASDNTVRVMAGRLRKALEAYYLKSETHQNISIALPKGSYIPKFSVSTPELAADQGDESPVHLSPRPNFLYLALACIALAVIASLLFRAARVDQSFSRAARVSTGPVVAVVPFQSDLRQPGMSEPASTIAFADGLYFDLVGKLSRFRDLVIVNAVAPGAESIFEAKSDLGVQFYLTGSIIRSDASLKVSAVLTNASDATIVWAETYTLELRDASEFLELESSIANEVASALGRPSSALNAQFQRETDQFQSVDAKHYICLLSFYSYTQRKSEPEHARVRECLSNAVAARDDFSSGWAALSWMYGDEARNSFNAELPKQVSKERALEAAMNAVDSDPTNAMAFQYLAVAQFELGNISGFQRAAKTALKLNPNDPEVLADIGSHMVQLGETEIGLPLVEKAIQLNPAHPPWYHGSVARHYYRTNQAQMALEHARAYARDETTISRALLVACLVQNGQLNRAKTMYGELLVAHPNFESDFEMIVAEWQMQATTLNRITDDLVLAGMSLAK